MKILKRSSSTENPVDTHYKGLDIDLEPLDKSDADFKVSSLETTVQYDFPVVVPKCFIKHMCFIVLYFHGHAFFIWKLLKSAFLCFIF